jgi:hypothetical protein
MNLIPILNTNTFIFPFIIIILIIINLLDGFNKCMIWLDLSDYNFKELLDEEKIKEEIIFLDKSKKTLNI